MLKRDAPNNIDGGYTIIYPLVDEQPGDANELTVTVWKDAQMATVSDWVSLHTEFTAPQLRDLAKACLEAAQELEILAKEKGKE